MKPSGPEATNEVGATGNFYVNVFGYESHDDNAGYVVDSLEESIVLVFQYGGSVLGGIVENKLGRFVASTDPAGKVFVLIEWIKPHNQI